MEDTAELLFEGGVGAGMDRGDGVGARARGVGLGSNFRTLALVAMRGGGGLWLWCFGVVFGNNVTNLEIRITNKPTNHQTNNKCHQL